MRRLPSEGIISATLSVNLDMNSGMMRTMMTITKGMGLTGVPAAGAAALLLCMQAGAPGTAQTAGTADEAALRAKVMAFAQGHAAGAGLPLGGDADMAIEFVDLNEDGTPEGLVILKGMNWCGMRGCAAFVLDLSGPQARSIGDFIGTALTPLPDRTGQWRDIALDGRRVRFQGDAYRVR